jgi:acetylornithine deacetylase/succinyl-diaminopimelate desuccinylase-like protein
VSGTESKIAAADRWCADPVNIARSRARLSEWIAIPSVSMEPAHAADVQRFAAKLVDEFRATGFPHAQIVPTSGHPAVYARWEVDPALPTVLVYAHGDVKPAPMSQGWRTDPFRADVNADGNLYGRGAIDDKGQLCMDLQSVEAAVHANGGKPPVNIEFVVEGAEEQGSAHFSEVLDKVTALRGGRRCDLVIGTDTGWVARDTPSIVVALRGLVQAEVTITGPSSDMHSGEKGGGILNPNDAAMYIASSLKDMRTQRVKIPSFYDGVRPLTAAERAEMDGLPYDATEWKRDAGDVRDTMGYPGKSTIERTTAWPTLEVNTIAGGYQGTGVNTSIPSTSTLKITCRLVEGQDPVVIAASLRKAIEDAAAELTGDGGVQAVNVHVGEGHGTPAVAVPTGHPAVRCAAQALEDVFGHRAVFTREGGSIPAITQLQQRMRAPVLLLGVGLPDDRMHGPNEKITLSQYDGGIRTMARIWLRIGEVLAPPGRSVT